MFIPEMLMHDWCLNPDRWREERLSSYRRGEGVSGSSGWSWLWNWLRYWWDRYAAATESQALAPVLTYRPTAQSPVTSSKEYRGPKAFQASRPAPQPSSNTKLFEISESVAARQQAVAAQAPALVRVRWVDNAQTAPTTPITPPPVRHRVTITPPPIRHQATVASPKEPALSEELGWKLNGKYYYGKYQVGSRFYQGRAAKQRAGYFEMEVLDPPAKLKAHHCMRPRTNNYFWLHFNRNKPKTLSQGIAAMVPYLDRYS